MSAASASAWPSSSLGAGVWKRSRTLAALTLRRLLDTASTCNEVSLSVMTVAVLKLPSSSNNTYIGKL